MCLIMKEDCIFCKIAKGEIHSATVYEDSHFTVILDVNPATKGHCLIIPKEHFDNIYDLDGETAGKLFALATCIARAMRDADRKSTRLNSSHPSSSRMPSSA